MTVAQGVTSRKRKRTPTVTTSSTRRPYVSDTVTWKELGFSSATAARIAFWDDLWEVPTCRSALKELNRRARSKVRSAPITDYWPNRADTKRLKSDFKSHSADLKRFARIGGPDIVDLRGVSLLCIMVLLVLALTIYT
jgi:hypothetical protein